MMSTLGSLRHRNWSDLLTNPRNRKRHLLIIVAALAVHLLLHYAIYIPGLQSHVMDVPYFRQHILHESEFLLIIVYAALVFGTRGGFIAIGVTAATSVPFILSPDILMPGYEPLPGEVRDLATQVGFILGMGVIMVLLNGIVERERARRLRLAEELKEVAETANQTKTDFLATVSHELRTPMTGIMGTTSLMYETELTGEQAEYLGIIEESSDSLLAVIDDVLQVANAEPDKAALCPAPFGLGAYLEGFVPSLKAQAERKGLAFHQSVDDGVPDALVGDTRRLGQVLANLVMNAIKFTEEGEVRLHVCVGHGEGPNDVTLHFEVSDTGIGIPMEAQQAVFEPFTQVEGYMTRRHGGTGLGLAIASRLVKQMSGRIWVDSQVVRGSTFHFTARFGLDGCGGLQAAEADVAQAPAAA